MKKQVRSWNGKTEAGKKQATGECYSINLSLPISLKEKVVPRAISLSSLQEYVPVESTEMLFTEILFVYCSPQSRWRFMGVSFNKTNGRTVEELASSIFREEPTQEIDEHSKES